MTANPRCDCQNAEGPPGARHVSEECPVHNDLPVIPPDPAANTEFFIGFALAVAHVARDADQPGMARNMMDGYGVTVENLIAAGVEDFDLDPIRKAMA